MQVFAMSDSTSHTLQRRRFDAWPDALLTRLSAEAPPDDGFTLSLAIVDTTFEPAQVRTVLLSAGECCVEDAHALRCALWPASRATQALRRHGRAALTWVQAGAFFQAQVKARYLGELACGLACFEARLESGEMQQVPYAVLRSGIRFEVTQARDEVAARWAEQSRQMRAWRG
jgi:hypothetical protein